MLSGYFLISLVAFFALSVCGAIFILTRLLAPYRPDAAKNSSYECGFDQASRVTEKLPIHYYRVALLFVLFDLEIAFLMPWAVSLKRLDPLGFFVGISFTGLLGLGLYYEWRKGVLQWR
ncbi:MAG: NADH-quinone oxidoreductase subunit A [Alphaproteobacteria bacterium]|nr:MAG: NADH-quinone oxidoreductase subunit A [Alphaproteobacteria bacterium]